MTKQIIINGQNIHDIPSFYVEVNRVFMQNESWKLGESLDAFDDLLYGGFGTINSNEAVELVWTNCTLSKTALGFETTKAYYQTKLEPGSPFNKKHFTDKLAELEAGKGQTYFDIVIEIIASHTNISLIEM